MLWIARGGSKKCQYIRESHCSVLTLHLIPKPRHKALHCIDLPQKPFVAATERVERRHHSGWMATCGWTRFWKERWATDWWCRHSMWDAMLWWDRLWYGYRGMVWYGWHGGDHMGTISYIAGAECGPTKRFAIIIEFQSFKSSCPQFQFRWAKLLICCVALCVSVCVNHLTNCTVARLQCFFQSQIDTNALSMMDCYKSIQRL